MASLTLPYPNLTNGQNADAIQVNANYAAIVTFLLTLIPHTDGTNAFTGLPVLPAAAPGATNAVRKDVLDTAVALRVKNVGVSGSVYLASGSATGVVLDGAGNATVIMGMTLNAAPYTVIVSPTSATAALVKATTIRSTTQFQILGTPSATVSFDWIALSL